MQTITETINNIELKFEHKNTDELWLNATDLLKKFNESTDGSKKRMDKYWDNEDTKEYIEELFKDFNSPSEGELNFDKLKEKVSFTAKGRYGGTFIHPDLSVHFTRWLSAKFAIA